MASAKILNRYIFREMLPPFFLSMTVLLLVLFLQKLFKLADLVVSKGASLLSIIKVFAYVMPSFLVITIPMSLIVASLTLIHPRAVFALPVTGVFVAMFVHITPSPFSPFSPFT